MKKSHGHPRTQVSKARINSAIFLTTLPLVFLIICFALAIAATCTADWTHHTIQDPTDADSSHIEGVIHRSPFAVCSLLPVPVKTSTNSSSTTTSSDGSATSSAAAPLFTEHCDHLASPGKTCDPDATSTKGDNAHFCQQLKISGQLMIAGNSLVGVGALLAFAMWTASISQLWTSGGFRSGRRLHRQPGRGHLRARPSAAYRRQENHSPMAYFSLLLLFLIVFGGLSLFMGQMIGANNLVNLQYPMGDWYTSGDLELTNHQTPWVIGKGVGMAIAAWVFAAAAGLILPLVWELPKVGVWDVEEEEEDDPVVGAGDEEPKK